MDIDRLASFHLLAHPCLGKLFCLTLVVERIALISSQGADDLAVLTYWAFYGYSHPRLPSLALLLAPLAFCHSLSSFLFPPPHCSSRIFVLFPPILLLPSAWTQPNVS